MKDKKFRNYLIVGCTLIVILSVCSYALIEFISNIFFFKNPHYDPISAIGMIVPMTFIILTSLTFFFKKIYQYIHKLLYGLEQVSQGNYNVQLDLKKSGPFSEVYNNFNHMVNELNRICYMNEDFINNFSHEFKTPIVSINGFANLLLNSKYSDQECREYLTIIYSESKRLSDLAQDTLLLSKLENTGILTNKEVYSLDKQIKRCMILLYSQTESKKIDIELDLKKILFLGNKELMEHIWINIISNAIKYTNENGKIIIDMSKTDDKVLVAIKDTGIGMSQDEISYIFDKFYQVDSSHSNKGLGLGLSITKKIVELHKGKIEVSSILGKGTTFKICLPLK